MRAPTPPAKILILGDANVIHAQRWAQYFAQRGWETRWLSLGQVPIGIDAEEIPQPRLPRPLRIALSARRVRRMIHAFAPDVVSALFLPDHGWLGTLAGVRPLVVSAWGSDVLIAPRKSPLHRHRIATVLRRADAVIADAESLRSPMLALGARPDAVTIVPLGVDDEWLAIAKGRATTATEPVTILSNRRLEPLYSVGTLVGALSILAERGTPKCRCVIIGEGSERETLTRMAAALAVTEAIQFLPWLIQEELRAQFAGAEVYVSTSPSDGTSVSLLEAMAAGCLPVVTDIPANREWIVHGENGLLFAPADRESLAEMLGRAMESPELRADARARNLKIIEARARWYDNMAVVEQVMQDTISRYRSA